MSLRRRVIRNIAVQWLEKVIVVPLRLVTFIIVTRALQPAEFGKYAVVTSMAIMFSFISDIGLDDTVVKKIAARPSESKGLLSGLLRVKLVLAAASIAAMLATVLVLGYEPGIIALAAVASASILLAALAAVATDYFRVNLRMTYVSAGSVASAVFLVAATYFVAPRGSPFAFVAAWSASSLVNLLVVGYFFAREAPIKRVRFDFSLWRTVTVAALPLGLSYFLSSVFLNVDVVILSRLGDFAATGIYSAAYKLVSFGLLFSATFVDSLYPLMARYWHENLPQLRRLSQQGFDYLNLVAWPMVVAIWMLAPKLMAALFKRPGYVEGALALQLLGVALGLMFVSNLTGYLLTATDNQKALLKISATGATANVVLNLLLVPRYSYIAAAAVTIVTTLIFLVPGLWLMQMRLDLRLSFASLPKTVLVAAACGVVLYLSAPHSLYLQLVLLALVFLVAIALTRSVRLGDLVSVLGRSESRLLPLEEASRK